jgi:hypothetical protein
VQAWEYYELSGFANSLMSPPPLLPAALGGGSACALMQGHAALARSPSVDSAHTSEAEFNENSALLAALWYDDLNGIFQCCGAGAAAFGWSRSRNATRLRLRQWYETWIGIKK